MMKLTAHQIESLGRKGWDDFLERLLKHLYSLSMLLGEKRENLREEALAAVNEARARGFRTEWQIAALVECVVVFGIDLQAEGIRSIVEDGRIHIDEKVFLVQGLA